MRIDEQLKQQLARELCAIIHSWTLSEASARMCVRPSRISELRHGKLDGFSIARLLQLIALHGYDVELALRRYVPAPRVVRRPSAAVMRYDRFGTITAPPR